MLVCTGRALQAIACGTRHIMEVMRENGHTISRLTLCGGATHNPLWLREYADATGCDIHLMQEEDAVTLGAAITGARWLRRVGKYSICMPGDGSIRRGD